MHSHARRLIFAIALGNTLVWYDIALFAFLAVPLSQVFFSSLGPDIALLVTFGTFAVAFLIRPLGALLLGSYADRRGRRRALLLATTLMMAGTAMIAFMPGYSEIGAAAPIGILIARIVQGLAAGGEFGSATAALAENNPEIKGYATSWQLASQTLSGAMAATAGLLLAATLDDDEIRNWGWRLPFLVGILVGPVGWYIRYRMPEDPQQGQTRHAPARAMFTRESGSLLVGIGLIVISTSITYLLIYIPSYATRTLGISAIVANTAVLVGFLIQLPVALLVGHVSDRFGRKRFLWLGLVGLMLSMLPAFWLITTTRAPLVVIAAVAWLAILKAIYSGGLPATLSELFPRPSRATGVALSYNVGVTLFGGTAAMTMAWLGQWTGSTMAPSIYLMAAAVLSALALVALHFVPRYDRA
jgi:MHS family proline/betaine transporter-like MFS transporter